MERKVATDTKKDSYAWVFFIGSIFFLVLGFFSSPLYFAGSIVAVSLLLAQRPSHRRASWLVLALAVTYFLVVFGYDVGKDMAARDNARDAMRSSGAAT